MLSTFRPESSEGSPISRASVLVIEDDLTFRAGVTECLESCGYKVLTASDGASGWHSLETYHPQVVVLELSVPVMSGFRFLRLLRSGKHSPVPQVPVAVTTRHDMEENPAFFLETRPDAYLLKPFSPERLVEVVDWLSTRPPRISLNTNLRAA